MKYKITLKGHLKMLNELIVFSIILIPFVVYIFKELLNPRTEFGVYFVLTVIFLIFILPAIYIHFDYFYVNRNREYELRNDMIIVKSINNDTKEMFSKKNIEKVIVYLSLQKMRNVGYSRFTFKDYFYIKIIMNDGKELLLTSLLDHNLNKICEDYFGKEKIEYSVNMYNPIK